MPIRDGRAEDLPAIEAIYRAYIERTPITFDLASRDDAALGEWASRFGPSGAHRWLVFEHEGALVGYATSTPFRPKPAYATSVELSIYLTEAAQGAGHGGALIRALLEALREAGVHRAYAAITVPNEASLALTAKLGFRRVGVLQEVGHKFGRYWDVELHELAL